MKELMKDSYDTFLPLVYYSWDGVPFINCTYKHDATIFYYQTCFIK